jgi:hypothetical protein
MTAPFTTIQQWLRLFNLIVLKCLLGLNDEATQKFGCV